MEHLVDERPSFHHIAHEHKERDREQNIVRHRTKSALNHQVKNFVVEPRLARVVEGGEAKHHTQPHEGEGGRKAHHDDHHDEGQHGQAECWLAHA